MSVRKTPISLDIYQIAKFLYVADAKLVALNNGKESVTCIVSRDQLLLDKWQKTLNITGGELNLEKHF